MASRTSRIVSSARSDAFSHPSWITLRTRVGSSSYWAARSRMGFSSALIASITGCLHSRQPMPAVRQPCSTQFLVFSSEYTWCRFHRAALGLARVAAAHARGVGLHPADLLRHRLGRLAQHDGVVVALRHLLAVEA